MTKHKFSKRKRKTVKPSCNEASYFFSVHISEPSCLFIHRLVKLLIQIPHTTSVITIFISIYSRTHFELSSITCKFQAVTAMQPYNLPFQEFLHPLRKTHSKAKPSGLQSELTWNPCLLQPRIPTTQKYLEKKAKLNISLRSMLSMKKIIIRKKK